MQSESQHLQVVTAVVWRRRAWRLHCILDCSALIKVDCTYLLCLQDEVDPAESVSAAPTIRVVTTENALDALLSMSEAWAEGGADSRSGDGSGRGRTLLRGLYSTLVAASR